VIYYADQYYETHGHLEFVHSVTGVRTLKDEFDKVASHNAHHLAQIRAAFQGRVVFSLENSALKSRIAMLPVGIETRRAHPGDAEAIAVAHLDSIQSIGPRFYPPEIVEAWGAGITPDLYVNAMEGGEVFFIATGLIDDRPAVLGFATHRVDDAQDGASVYVRGVAARQGIGTILFRLAEEHARAHGATSIHIQASLAGVAFYTANGFEELGRGDALLVTGRSMPCVFMRKLLTPK
jgi:putative acetyltransferase